MKIKEILPNQSVNPTEERKPIAEMAFKRSKIINSIMHYQPLIAQHAVKIIVFPHSRDVQHWRDEIVGWAGFLSKLRLKSNNKTIGEKLTYEYLYDGPFGGNEYGMTEHFVQMAEIAHKTKLKVDINEVHKDLKEFLTMLSMAVGEGKDVRPVVNSL